MPKIPHTELIPISQISPGPNRYRYQVHIDFFQTDTDTGYQYLVSVPGIGIIPGIGRTLLSLHFLCTFFAPEAVLKFLDKISKYILSNMLLVK